jgi:hypothetical protein
MNSVNSSRKKNRVRELIDVGGITPFTTIDYPGQLAAGKAAPGVANTAITVN